MGTLWTDTNYDVLKKYFRYLHTTPPDWPDNHWRGVRAMENAVTGYWLYRQTGESWILETNRSIQENSFDWTSFYEKFPWDSIALAEKRIPVQTWTGLTAHGGEQRNGNQIPRIVVPAIGR